MIDRSSRSQTNKVSSVVTIHIDRYLDSAKDKEIEACFLDLQEIRAPSRLMKNPLTDLHVSLQEAQSTSQKAIREKDGFDVKNKS